MENLRIKILYVQVAPGGGSLIALYELLRKIDKTIFYPVVLCYHKNTFNYMLEEVEGCKVLYLPANIERKKIIKDTKNKLLNVLQIQWQSMIRFFFYKRERDLIFEIIEKEKPAFVHHNNDVTMNRHAIRAAHKSGLPQIVHHRSLANYGNDYTGKILDRSLMKKIHASVYISQTVADHFINLYKLTDNNGFVLHDFVDIEKFKSAIPNAGLKKSLGISENDIVIISVGRIKEWKGQHILIDALYLLKNELAHFKMFFIGSDEEGIGSKEYQQKLNDLLETYNLKENIFFTGNRNDIPDLINLSDIVVHSSVKPEPQGLIIIETLLCRKTIIASGFAGSEELIKKYGGESFFPVTAKALAEKLRGVIIENRRKSRVNDEKYFLLKKDFTPANQIAIINKLYQNILNRKSNA